MSFLFIRSLSFNATTAIYILYIILNNRQQQKMSASKRFRFAEWTRSLATPNVSSIEITDDLTINFDDCQNSSTCEIWIQNYGQQNVTIAGVSYENNLLQLAREPECKTIESFDLVNYSFQAIHFTDRRMASAAIRLFFADEKMITRTILIDYNNNARRSLNILDRKKCFYDIPQVFIEATDPTYMPSKIIDLVDALVPTFDELVYENYQAHFHGLLYLEERCVNGEYAHLVKKGVAFRKEGNYFELDYPHSRRLMIGIGKQFV